MQRLESGGYQHLLGMHVSVVPDDDAQARTIYDPELVAQLTTDGAIIRINSTLFMRAATWERVKHKFPQQG